MLLSSDSDVSRLSCPLAFVLGKKKRDKRNEVVDVEKKKRKKEKKESF